MQDCNNHTNMKFANIYWVYLILWKPGQPAKLQRRMPHYAWKYTLQAISYHLRWSGHQTAKSSLNRCSAVFFSSSKSPANQSEKRGYRSFLRHALREWIQTLTATYALPPLPHSLKFAAWGINLLARQRPTASVRRSYLFEWRKAQQAAQTSQCDWLAKTITWHRSNWRPKFWLTLRRLN